MALRRRRDIWDVIVIGGGIAGLTAAWHASHRGLSVALFEAQPACGGQVGTVNELDDWPATGPVSGVELASSLVERIGIEGVGLFYENVAKVAKDGELWRVTGEKSELRGKRIIAASGARLRTLGVPGEEALRGMGVSQCAHCDGGFFKGQDVAVIGGGDAAMQEAIVLTGTCRTVYIIVRGDLSARRTFADRAAGKSNVKFIWDTEVEAVLGKTGVTGLKVRSRKDGATSELPCDGVFPFVGVEPNNAFLPASIKRDANGCVITNERFHSNEPTLYAIGALRAGYGGDLISAAGEAAQVAAMISDEVGILAK